MSKTLFDKVWDSHVVRELDGGRSVFYIDRHYIHEVTSPVAFLGLKKRGLSLFRPTQTIAMPDHNIPTLNQHLPIEDRESRSQVEMLIANCKEAGVKLYNINDQNHGIVHVAGPEAGYTLPGQTIVCGDSHTSTHGAFGAIAFGIGTSEVEMVFASQCVLQPKPKSMRITVDGVLRSGVEAKDIILYIISKISASGGTGHFIEFAGSAISSLSMEGRMTVCNMSIECGARGGMIAPDQTTFDYLKDREAAPKGADWQVKVEQWRLLYSDADAVFDTKYHFNASDIKPMITYGTNPGMGIAIDESVPTADNLMGSDRDSFLKSLLYMGFLPGERLLGKAIDYVFVGSCTNGRIEDFRTFAQVVKGHKKAEGVTCWLVPGSKAVEEQAHKEGLVEIFTEAGFEFRQPGCSACLAMNADKVPSGAYCVSTSNRNFEGRQGPGARTLLCGARVAALAAITGVITNKL